MANWNKDDLAYDNQSTRFEVMMVANSSGVIFDKFPIDGTVSVTLGGTPGANGYNSNPSTDAFGRLRVSNPFTLFDNNFRYSDNSFNWDESITGTANSTYNSSEGIIDLYTGTANNDEIIRETQKVFSYQPGKSLLVLNTFQMGEPKANLRQRIGYFGAENGVYIQREANNYSVVMRTSVSGSTVNKEIAQANWNIDPMDGTGPSGLVLDLDKSQIFWSDFEWLGVGSVRTGFVINGLFCPVHVFHHANSGNTTYMTTASLPVRYEIKNTGITSSNSILKQICSSVISEGGYTKKAITRSATTALTGRNLSQVDNRPLVSIRLKSDRLDEIVLPSVADFYGLQQAAFKYTIISGGTVGGGSWVSAGAESGIEYNVTANTITGGTILAEGIFVGDNKGGASRINFTEQNHSYQLRRKLDGTAQPFTICALATTNNDDDVGSLSWEEH